VSEELPSGDGVAGLDFIRSIVAQDVANGKNGGRVETRFPPEPNGYLHIGHAKAICLNFGLAAEYDADCHLRFDDTNPTAESTEYVEGIIRDIRWFFNDTATTEIYTSSYFDQLHAFAVKLIEKGLAFVCDLSSEEIAAHRGNLTEPGRPSPHRDRSVEENLDLFARMKAGEFENGGRTLRAKIDMASPNLVLRDPILYRVHKVSHHRTGDAWCIYPMYDFAHCLSDSIESITHSLCSLEFADRRALYDWILDALGVDCHPQQIEFARLNLSYTLMSKRLLKEIVESGFVAGWDDPRMPTIAGMRRRGYPPRALRSFCEDVGVAKRDNTIQLAKLEASVRDELNRTAPRAMAVIDPLKIVIENYPEGEVELLEAANNPSDPEAGTRQVPFSRELYIERGDFLEDPPKKFFRLAPGREVRLRFAYFVTCTEVVKDADGTVVELRCTYDPATRGGDAPDGRKVKGTLHWVSVRHALSAEVREYETLFSVEDPSDAPEGGSSLDYLNPDSLVVRRDCKLEPELGSAQPGSHWQFERTGYFSLDPDSTESAPIWNRTVTLRDTWAKLAKK
jgi:glutaminyl-tRNA synthetase